MKRCPGCGREYDNTMMFCLDDGTELLYGPASMDEPATAILSERAEIATGYRAGEAKTAIFRSTIDPAIENTNSIAVLPFANMSADEENEYFCDGLAEDLLNALAKIDDLKVAARTSAFSFKGKKANVADIGKALNVNSILEGSVRKSGDRLRITVQLINAADGYHLWSEQYNRRMQDIFDVQDEITLAVVDALKLKLLGSNKADVLKRHTENTEAYKAFLLGRYLRHTKNDHSGAHKAFEEAVRLDPLSAPSWVALAEGTILAAHYGIIHAREACERAKECLATAEELQGETADAYYVRGFVGFVEADWPTWEKAYRRAIEIQAGQVQVYGSFGLTLCVRGQFDEALIFFERAREADPFAPFPYAITGAGMVTMGRHEDSLPYFEQAITFERENLLTLWSSSLAHIALGNYAEGVTSAERGVEVSRRGGFFVGVLGWTYAVSGRTDDARAILEELKKRPENAPSLVPEVWLLAALGEKEAAFALLARADAESQAFVNYVNLPGFDPLRGDSRFTDLIRRRGLPEIFASNRTKI